MVRYCTVRLGTVPRDVRVTTPATAPPRRPPCAPPRALCRHARKPLRPQAFRSRIMCYVNRSSPPVSNPRGCTISCRQKGLKIFLSGFLAHSWHVLSALFPRFPREENDILSSAARAKRAALSGGPSHVFSLFPPASRRVDVHGAVLDVRVVALELVVHGLGDDVSVPQRQRAVDRRSRRRHTSGCRTAAS